MRMDNLRLMPGCFRLLMVVFIVLALYQPCCQGLASGRAAVASKNRLHKVSTKVMASTKGNISLHKGKRPSEIHRTRIVPSTRVTSCLKLQCPVSTPKSCRYLTIVLLRGGKRCRRCTIKRSRKCRVSKTTKKVLPRKIKTISKSSSITAKKSRKASSARIKGAAIRKKTRAKLNNFEGRWMKGFSSD
ncbi:uncharacterized protein LOC117336284 [Pecten maximus]|uniref:uncharacterized protein LOC117336284 n=1 Tax=Pecten maximus TaxID=6579 RepID=UPI00145829CD|nr:uncharacterized protein LOC117336284 [Pecten maximus]